MGKKVEVSLLIILSALITIAFCSCDLGFLMGEPKVTKQAPEIIETGGNGDIDGDGIPDHEDPDIDGDGLSNGDEINLFGTNPRRKDTDGDGWDDATELSMYDSKANPYRFSPLIADLPRVQLIIEDIPDIGYIYASSTSTTEEKSFTQGKELSSGRTNSSSNTMSTAMEHGWSIDTSIGQEITFGTKKTEFTLNWDVTVGASGSYSQESAYEWGKEWTTSNTQSQEEAESFALTEDISYSSGYVRVPVSIKNNGYVGYTIQALELASYYLNPYKKDSIKSVANLELQSNNGFSMLTIAPGATKGPFVFEYTQLGLDMIPVITTKASSLITALNNFTISITDDKGSTHDFSGTSTNVAALCAEVSIDYGPGINPRRDAEKFMVAARTKFNENYTSLDDLYLPTMLSDVLDILHLSYGTDSTGVYTGFNSLGGIANNPATRAYWFICVQDEGSDKVAMYSVNLQSFDLSDIEVHAGQKISFIYSTDGDQDGLTLRIEELYGSSDSNFDSDGDNIRDFDEVRGWNRDGVMYTTNPALADTDCDGMNDDVDPIPVYRPLSTITTIENIRLYSSDQATLLATALPSGSTIQSPNISRSNVIPVVTTVEPAGRVELDGQILIPDTTAMVWTGTALTLAVSESGSENAFEISVTPESGSAASYSLIIPSPLADVSDFHIPQGSLVTSGMENTVYYTLQPVSNWATCGDDRIQGVILFWSTTADKYPREAVCDVTQSSFTSFTGSLPNTSNSLAPYSTHVEVDSSGGLEVFNAQYYNKTYYFKLFTYSKNGDGFYYYSKGVNTSFNPPDPRLLTITVDAVDCKVENAQDDALGGLGYDLTIDLAIDIAVKHAFTFNAATGTYIPTVTATNNLEKDPVTGTGNEADINYSSFQEYAPERSNGTFQFPEGSETSFNVDLFSYTGICTISTYIKECDWYYTVPGYYPGETIRYDYATLYSLNELHEGEYAPYSGVKNTSISESTNFFYYGGNYHYFDPRINIITVNYQIRYATTGTK